MMFWNMAGWMMIEDGQKNDAYFWSLWGRCRSEKVSSHANLADVISWDYGGGQSFCGGGGSMKFLMKNRGISDSKKIRL